MIDIKSTRKATNSYILTVKQFDNLMNLRLPHASKQHKAREVFVFLVALGIRFQEFLSVDRFGFRGDAVMVTVKNQPEKQQVMMTPLAKWIASKYFLGFPSLTHHHFNQGLRVIGFRIGLALEVESRLKNKTGGEAICPLYLIATTQLIRSNHFFLKSTGTLNKLPEDSTRQYSLF